jgi:dipeptidyl aminopeptidase/acylaminoacyl peptidase
MREREGKMADASTREPDATIKAARTGWVGRMVAAGVPLSDFQEVACSIDSYDDWCRAWSERASMHEKFGRAALLENQNASAASHLFTAAIEYHFAKFYFTQDPKQMKAAHMKAVECYTLALPHFSPPGERVAIPYDGKHLYGYLRKPVGAVGRQPVILIISGMDSTKEEQKAYEELFLARGIATLSFDGPGQGEAEYDWPVTHKFEEPVGAVIDFVEKRIDLDASRIGISGASMGGYYAPRAAAFEKRVKAAIANSGAYKVIDNFDQRPATLKGAYVLRTHSKTIEEAREKTRPFDMEGVASKITTPMFIICGKADHITKWTDAERVSKEVKGPCVFVALEGGIHVGHNRGHLWKNQCADWMAEQLGVPKK